MSGEKNQNNFSDAVYLGLDIGTNSVGWAVTNGEYKLRKFKNNLMWGVNLFESANPAEQRRMFRTARRRYDRRQQRITLLQELLGEEILKKDKRFFLRLKESALLPEDCEIRKHNTFFDDENYTDKDYFKEYPTIHHLICELINNPEPHDIRLVYLACAYILAHRGHFLLEVDKDNVSQVLDFKKSFDDFISWFDSRGIDRPFNCDNSELGEILKKKISSTSKENELKKLLYGGKVPAEEEDYPIKLSLLIKMLAGRKVSLSEMFKKENYKNLEKDKVSVSSADFTDTLEELYSQLDDGDADLLAYIKAIYDWSLLIDNLNGRKLISQAKVDIYDTHHNDLKQLKYICRKYLTHQQYIDIFKTAGDKANYVRYTYNVTSVKKPFPDKFKKCTQEDFCKYIKKMIDGIKPDDGDREAFSELNRKLDSNSLCPKQVNGDNRVIPFQLYYAELKALLGNAEKYLQVLNVSDEDGTVKDKILSLMYFKIPYYVGPLVKRNESDNVWVERKFTGRITPWNFDRMVDKDVSEERFIRRMTGKCTYYAGKDVLPKYSILYSKFTVLNEINNIKINGKEISVKAKQEIFNELFKKKRRVSVKDIKNLLTSTGEMNNSDEFSGIDINIKSSMTSYIDFRNLIENGALDETQADRIIERITVTTDKERLKRWIKANFDNLSYDDINYLSKLKYNDYGRLSRELLTEIFSTDSATGETDGVSIIERMYNENLNLMQLLSVDYGYSAALEKLNQDYYSDHPKTIAKRLEEMYIPNAVRRSIIRTLAIAKELKGILPKQPDKIFIEMARGGDPKKDKKGVRKESRKEQLRALFEEAEKAGLEVSERLSTQLEALSDSDLRNEKYYLYFTQLGRCMYSGEAIDFDKIGVDTIYNVDHIFPQSKIKDDSISNKALVLSTINSDKGDKYPIKPEIRTKMKPFWNVLKNKKLISEKKYERLTRNYPFTDEELSAFINRQLVETRQSTKAAAQLLKDIFPNSDIVYVKAVLASDFRKKYDMLKCREVNDLHHAKDAYLNIVLGNIYDVKFTKSPLNFIKSGEKYTLNYESMLSYDIERNGVTAWDKDKSMAAVRKTMSKNSIRFVRYAFTRKGGFFNQNPEKAKPELVPRKSKLDSAKYGGYNDTTASEFAIVKCKKQGITIIPIELLYKNKFESDLDFAKKYAADMISAILGEDISAEQISFPLEKRNGILKVNAMLEIDGFRGNLIKKSNKGKTLGLSCAVPLIVSKDAYEYIKKLSSFAQKSESGRKFSVTKYDGITSEKNIELFDYLCQKTQSKPYCVFLKKIGDKMIKAKEKFESLNETEQAIGLLNITSLFKTGRSTGCDLTCAGASLQSGAITINSSLFKLTEFKSICIIDQSDTGLFEKKSPNLLEL